MTHIKKLEDEIVRNGMTFIKMTEEMDKLQHEIKLLATDNEKLSKENEKLLKCHEELQRLQAKLMALNYTNPHLQAALDMYQQTLKPKYKAPIEEILKLKQRHEELIEEDNKSSANAHRLLSEVALLTKVAEASEKHLKKDDENSAACLDFALSAWRKWKEKM